MSGAAGWVVLGLAVGAVAAEGAIRLCRPIRAPWPPVGLRPETAVRAEPVGRPVALVLGDSIAYGHSLDASQAWPAVLEQALSGRMAVVNAGVEGQTSAMALLDAPALLRRFHPDVVVIGFGLNDGNLSRSWVDDEREWAAIPPAGLAVLRNSRLFRAAEARARRRLRGRDADAWANRPLPRVSPDAYRRALRALVRQARAAGARRVLLLTASPLAASGGLGTPAPDDQLRASYAQYNDIVREVAAETCAELVDVARAFVPGAEMFQEDGVHLTAEGEAQLAALVRSSLAAEADPGGR